MDNLKNLEQFISEKNWIAGAVEGTKGKLRKQMGLEKGETLTKSMVQKEITKLKGQDTDPETPGAQLPPAKAKKYKRLNLAKTLMKLGEDHGETNNYMFFGNLMNIKRMCEELLKMDPKVLDQILSDGHGWATDHIATSKDDVEEVYNFIQSEMMCKDEEGEFHGSGMEDEKGLISDGENC
jgi:hypothetical protein